MAEKMSSGKGVDDDDVDEIARSFSVGYAMMWQPITWVVKQTYISARFRVMLWTNPLPGPTSAIS